MHLRHRLRSLVLLAPLGCSFDAFGLGEATGGPTAGAESGSTSGAEPASTDPSTSGAGSSTSGMGGSGATASEGVAEEDASGGPPSSSYAPAICGDGVVDRGELCDDGEDNGPARPCTPECAVNVCGDGHVLDPNKNCDDGNHVDDDLCRNDCTLAATCGNKKIDDGETCDDGNHVDTDTCIACKKAACGDGFVQANVESCDDGSESAACNADCSLAQCGDSKLNVSAGELCDLGPKNGVYASGCADDCGSAGAYCGDGVVDLPDEKCDPKQPIDFATCAANCQSMQCADGRGNCDDDFATGCEIDLEADHDHCGQCDKDCGIWSCKGGSCGI